MSEPTPNGTEYLFQSPTSSAARGDSAALRQLNERTRRFELLSCLPRVVFMFFTSAEEVISQVMFVCLSVGGGAQKNNEQISSKVGGRMKHGAGREEKKNYHIQ